MIARKSKSRPTTRIWPYTPEPSPPLESTEIHISVTDDFKMANDHSQSRPISVVSKREGILSPSARPTLDDVLNNRAPPPYTLAAYTAFLSQQHCLETLEFVTEAKKYAEKYDEAAAIFCGMPLTSDTDEGFELKMDWTRIMDIYVKPGAPREINLPAEERDDLVDEPYETRPPKPESLEPAVSRMRDLMSDSIFIPFCNSVKAPAHAQTYNAISEISQDPARREIPSTFDERSQSHQRHTPQRKRSPPNTSAFQPSRSPPQNTNRASALSSALNRNSSARLSTHVSNSSAASESALTDDSGNGSPAPGENHSSITPPLTPPTSDLPVSHNPPHDIPILSAHGPKPSRSESGGWKRMGMKIFGQKRH